MQLYKKGSSFTAVLYMNENKRQLVLAHKGIDLDFASLFKVNGQMKQKNKEIMLNEIVPELANCFEIVGEANFVAKEKGFFLSFTGYSNGAWLAEHSINFSKVYFENEDSRAVLFESPGISKGDKEDQKSSTSSPHEELDIVNYLSAPNFANSVNRHAGKVYRLFVNEEPGESKTKSQDNNLDSFIDKIKSVPKYGELICEKLSKSNYFLNGLYWIFCPSNLRKLLERFDKVSGLPLEYEQVEEWPAFTVSFNDIYRYELKTGFSFEKRTSNRFGKCLKCHFKLRKNVKMV
jgi:hypothetical protein